MNDLKSLWKLLTYPETKKNACIKMPTYRNFCVENGYLTKNNQLRYTAEIIYKFITGNNDFEESHTGLEDVLIEKEILAYLYRQHKKMEKRLWAE